MPSAPRPADLNEGIGARGIVLEHEGYAVRRMIGGEEGLERDAEVVRQVDFVMEECTAGLSAASGVSSMAACVVS